MMSKPRPIAAFAVLAFAAAPAALFAQPQSAPRQPDFRSLWTGWDRANSDSMKVEREAVERVREDYATAAGSGRETLQNQGRALGERVGEIVRTGDCAEGERVARQAGDFALVKAVRDHCEALREPDG
ncbi:MAG TPA: hypothetical protein VF704_05225 [Allosphingosinicella sp.]|jgi:hypothetical protein